MPPLTFDPKSSAGSSRKDPWDRELANEFYEIERRSLEVHEAWLRRIGPTDNGRASLAPVDLYALQVDAPGWLKLAAAERKSVVMGLVPHYRVFVHPHTAFFPLDKIPQPRQRIHIETARRVIHPLPLPGTARTWTTEGHPIVEVEDWLPLAPESVYLDSDLQAKDVPKFYKEHLRVDDHVGLDLMLPSTSAAYGAGGGLNMAGRMGNRNKRRVHDMLWVLQMGMPTEYRTRPRLARHAAGRLVPHGPLRFRFSDLPPPHGHRVAHRIATNLSGLPSVRSKGFEYSTYAGLTLPHRGENEQIKAFLTSFTTAHCAIPVPFGDLVDMDVDLERFVAEADSSLHKAHVLLRQRQPLPGDIHGGVAGAADIVRRAFDMSLEDVMPREGSRRFFIRRLMEHVPMNLLETGLGFARLRGSNAGREDAVHAAQLLAANVAHAVELLPRGIRLEVAEREIRRSQELDPAEDAVASCLIASGPLVLEAVVESTVGLPGLETPEGVLHALDRLRQRALVIERPDGKYLWIG